MISCISALSAHSYFGRHAQELITLTELLAGRVSCTLRGLHEHEDHCGLIFAIVCRFGKYELHDLVVLDQQTTGVIISVSKDTCKVLTTEVRFSLNTA